MSDVHFRKGQWVEVTSDEEGFRGAWFVAKIIRLPLGWNDDTSSSSSSSVSKAKIQQRKDEFLIEYKSIMEDEEGTKRLREYVHTSCTRPLPPKEPGRVFELNEFVDAFDRDGWWKGVITQVFENQFKYIVYFKTTEEKLEFLQSDVRVHLEWIDGQWSKPRKQQQQEIKQNDAEGSKKTVKKRGRPPKEKSPTEQGKGVCKSKETDKQSIRSSKKRRGSATKCKVKDKGSGLKAFGPQASYDADMSITEVLRDIADEFQSPPVTDNKEVASRKNPSVVSTKVLSNIADESQSPLIIDNKGISPAGILASKSNNTAIEEDPSVRTEISRDTADDHQSSPMIDNKGISPDGILASKSNNTAIKEDLSVRTEISRDTADDHQSSSMIDNKGISLDGILVSKSNNATTEEDPSSRTEILRDTADEHQSSPMIDNKGISPDGILFSKSNNAATKEDPSVRTEILRGISPDGILVSKSNNATTEEDPSVRTEILRDTDEHQSSPMIDRKGISDGILVSKSNNAATVEDPSSRTEILRDTADERQSSPLIDKKEISPDKVSQSNEVATKEDTLLQDLENPESVNLTKSSEEDTCMGNQCNDAIKKQNEMGSASVDNQCKDSRKGEKEVTLASVYNRCDEASSKQNQMEDSSVNHETRKECDEVHLEAPVIGSTNDKVSVENESLPFVKTSLMWERILAMEIFHKMPQRPHFHPLKQYNMAQREGMAIGHMVTFANVVAKTRASHIDDPRSNLEEMSKALVDLEVHGFNVQAIQSRVQRLLEMKDKQLMLEKKSKEVEVKIIELKNKKDKFKTQLDKVKENLRFHEEAIIRCKKEHEVLMKEMDKIGSDTSVCLMELDVTADNSKSVKLEYPSVAAGPW